MTASVPTLSPAALLYAADLLRTEAKQLREQARTADSMTSPGLWARAKDLDLLADELENR